MGPLPTRNSVVAGGGPKACTRQTGPAANPLCPDWRCFPTRAPSRQTGSQGWRGHPAGSLAKWPSRLTLDAVDVDYVDTPRITPGTVPGAVPKVVPALIWRGSRKATLAPVSGRVCGANPAGTWQSIPRSKGGANGRLSRTVSCHPVLKAIARVMAKVTYGRVCGLTREANSEALFRAPQQWPCCIGPQR
jgi:hypothetical protein